MVKTVVVLAVPRSGSSALSGVLHKLGVRMGSNIGLRIGKQSNKYGCFENQDFLSYNMNTLVSAGCHFWGDIPDDEKISYRVNKSIRRVRRLIKRHERELWGWKDPTVIYTLPYFHQHLNNPYYIVLRRNVDSIVHSYEKLGRPSNLYFSVFQFIRYFRLRLIFLLGLKLIKTFIFKGNIFTDSDTIRNFVVDEYGRIDGFVRDKKHIEIGFDDLLNNTEKVISDIVRFLDINPSKKQISDALGFVHPELVHF